MTNLNGENIRSTYQNGNWPFGEKNANRARKEEQLRKAASANKLQKKRISHFNNPSTDDSGFSHNVFPHSSSTKGSSPVKQAMKEAPLMKKAKAARQQFKKNIENASKKKFHLKTSQVQDVACNSQNLANSKQQSTATNAAVVKKVRMKRTKKSTVTKKIATKSISPKPKTVRPATNWESSDDVLMAKKTRVLKEFKIPKKRKSEEKHTQTETPTYTIKKCTVSVKKLSQREQETLIRDVADAPFQNKNCALFQNEDDAIPQNEDEATSQNEDDAPSTKGRKYRKRIIIDSDEDDDQVVSPSAVCQMFSEPPSYVVTSPNSDNSAPECRASDVPVVSPSVVVLDDDQVSHDQNQPAEFTSNSQDSHDAAMTDPPVQSVNPISNQSFISENGNTDDDDDIMIIEIIGTERVAPIPIPIVGLEDDDEDIICLGAVMSERQQRQSLAEAASHCIETPSVSSAPMPERTTEPEVDLQRQALDQLFLEHTRSGSTDLRAFHKKLRVLQQHHQMQKEQGVDSRKKSPASSGSNNTPAREAASTSGHSANIARQPTLLPPLCQVCFRPTTSICSTCLKNCCYIPKCVERHEMSCRRKK